MTTERMQGVFLDLCRLTLRNNGFVFGPEFQSTAKAIEVVANYVREADADARGQQGGRRTVDLTDAQAVAAFDFARMATKALSVEEFKTLTQVDFRILQALAKLKERGLLAVHSDGTLLSEGLSFDMNERVGRVRVFLAKNSEEEMGCRFSSMKTWNAMAISRGLEDR